MLFPPLTQEELTGNLISLRISPTENRERPDGALFLYPFSPRLSRKLLLHVMDTVVRIDNAWSEQALSRFNPPKKKWFSIKYAEWASAPDFLEFYQSRTRSGLRADVHLP